MPDVSIEQALRTYLLSKADVTALVQQRIYPQMAPQGVAYPRITYSRTGTGRRRALHKSDEMPTVQVEVTYWGGLGAPGYEAAKTGALALEKALEGFKGKVGNWAIDALWVDDEFDAQESPEFASENDPRGVTFRLEIHHRESLPNQA